MTEFPADDTLEEETATEEEPPNKGISRRSILIGGGAVAVGLGVGGVALAGRDPAVDFVSADYGSSGPRTLVAYDSQYGSTGGVADAIGQRLGRTRQVEVRKLTEVTDISAYEAMVFGSPVQASQMKESAVTWLSEHAADITMPLAMFMPSASFGIDPDKEKQTAEKLGWLEQAASQAGVDPVAMQPFGGLVDFSKMSVMRGVIYRLMSGTSEEGDWRNFDDIRAWADEINPLLLA